MKNLTLEDIIYINELTIKKHGGAARIKNQSLIESSLNSGLATFAGEDLYPTAVAGYDSRWRVEKKTYDKLVEDGYVLWKKTTRNDGVGK